MKKTTEEMTNKELEERYMELRTRLIALKNVMDKIETEFYIRGKV